MDDIAPGALQRLREADIVGLAGLAGASLGQEYCRSGYVSTTKRQGKRLSGVLTVPGVSPDISISSYALQTNDEKSSEMPASQICEVEAEIVNSSTCHVVCSCCSQTVLICEHAAALLYQWIHHPYAFVSFTAALPEETDEDLTDSTEVLQEEETRGTRPFAGNSVPTVAPLAAPHPTSFSLQKIPITTISEALTQLGLSELRTLARHYGITATGLGKQQLMETMIEMLAQPEVIRRVVATLEKPQRQLLAAFALAGGSMSDEDLRGLFERFGLSSAGTLQEMLSVLQEKGLMVRTSFHLSSQQRFTAGAAPMDVSWYMPQEVRESLRVTLPVTTFDVEIPYSKNSSRLPLLHLAAPYKLLSDMLLVARILHGTATEPHEKRPARSSLLPANRLPSDGSIALPPPDDEPSVTTIKLLASPLPRSAAFLRFVVRLLHTTNLLYKEENWSANLHALPDTAQILLGPARYGIIQDLFNHWRHQVNYAELFELTENGVRIRCRSTPLNQPNLRHGELEQENNEARQELLTLLTQVPTGQWVNFSSFSRLAYRLHPTFLQRRQSLFPAPHWWIEQEEGQPLHPTQLTDWLRAEGRYLAFLLEGPLYWWGICDLARSVDGQLLAFRFNQMADLFFHNLPSTEPPEALPSSEEPAFTVSSEGQILIPCLPANWPLIARIENFAESSGVQEEKLSYYITAHSLNEAISQGYHLADLLSILRSWSAGREDDNTLRTFLEVLERRIASYGHVRLYTDTSLIQTVDASVMQQITASTAVDEQTLRAIHPTLLLLKKQGIEQIIEELKRRGQPPLLHEEA